MITTTLHVQLLPVFHLCNDCQKIMKVNTRNIDVTATTKTSLLTTHMAVWLPPGRRSMKSFLGCVQVADDRSTQPGSCQFSTATRLNAYTATEISSASSPTDTTSPRGLPSAIITASPSFNSSSSKSLSTSF